MERVDNRNSLANPIAKKLIQFGDEQNLNDLLLTNPGHKQHQPI